jgi:hypothetical protein
MTDADQYDLGKLTDAELELLGRLLLKAAGEFDGDVVPEIRIVREIVDQPPASFENDMK